MRTGSGKQLPQCTVSLSLALFKSNGEVTAEGSQCYMNMSLRLERHLRMTIYLVIVQKRIHLAHMHMPIGQEKGCVSGPGRKVRGGMGWMPPL